MPPGMFFFLFPFAAGLAVQLYIPDAEYIRCYGSRAGQPGGAADNSPTALKLALALALAAALAARAAAVLRPPDGCPVDAVHDPLLGAA
eukprot:CAMPEP_0179106972 /NCGR_PEP_ID=MMETSP0796-20121207/49767_1 /TAXON_ID=73915 /ORGANISM="Pyrodinium bahamense, Strain pbaha01" /LENGTH=88 /DNA_ID=CAMNT_0020805023 /DNA_START=22 /DNA_END=285 /DNA_ORIENTATION=+